MYPIAFKNAANPLLLCIYIPSHNGISTDSNASIPYGVAASAKAAIDNAVIVLTFCYSSLNPPSTISTIFFKWGKTAHPIKIAIYYIILIPVCLAYQDFLDWQTALKKGSN